MTLLFKFLRQFWLGWCPDFSVISLQKKTKVPEVKLLQLIEPPAETETPENRQLGVQQIWRVYNTRLPPKRCGSQSSCRHRFAPKRKTAGGNIFLPIPRSRRKYRRRRRHDRVRRFFFFGACAAVCCLIVVPGCTSWIRCKPSIGSQPTWSACSTQTGPSYLTRTCTCVP